MKKESLAWKLRYIEVSGIGTPEGKQREAESLPMAISKTETCREESEGSGMLMGCQDLKYSTPEAQGISSESILRFLEEVRKNDQDGMVDLHSFQIIRNDFVIAEGAAAPFGLERYHRIYSAAKGIIAIGVLLAVQDKILDLKERITDIFADNLPENLSERMKQVTVYHLLTMNTGHAEDTCATLFQSDNWVKTFLSIEPEYEPGTYFCYNNGIPHILAAIVEKKSGVDIISYMRPRFLTPLGIDILCRHNAQGEREPSTVCVTQEALTKIGYVFLKKGKWNGRQLIDESLCEEFGRFHVPTITHKHAFRSYGYGYQVWKMPCDGFVFHGGNDNLSCVYREADLVFSCMACNKTQHEVDLEEIFHNIVYKNSLAYPIKENPEAYQRLQVWLQNWNLAPKGSDRSGLTDTLHGKIYSFEPNLLGCETIQLEFMEAEEKAVITSVQNGKIHRLICGLNGTWPECEDYILIPENMGHGNFIDGEDSSVNIASGAWRERNIFRVYGRSFGRIESDKFTFYFEEDRLTVDIMTPALALPGVVTDRKKGRFILQAMQK